MLLVLLTCVTANAKQRHALLVLIGNYPQNSEWWSIHAQTDGLWLSTPLAQQGYVVTLLQDEQATKQGIINAVQRMNEPIEAGGVVLMKCSVHGRK